MIWNIYRISEISLITSLAMLIWQLFLVQLGLVSGQIWQKTHFLPREFGIFLGDYDLEIVRIVLVYLGDVFRFSLATARSVCPFCPIELHAPHLFTCPNFPAPTRLPSWENLLRSFRSGNWQSFMDTLFFCLSIWCDHTLFFHDRASANIKTYSSRG